MQQRKTVITRGISNDIVRRMNDKAYWHFFDDKTQFNELFKEWIPRKWLLINADTPLDKLEDMMTASPPSSASRWRGRAVRAS